ncbi:MAG TPA: hypothetical protein VIZ28_10080 [Chitinophagaceae bacterium]
MKKLFFLPVILLISVLTIMFFSCTKEEIAPLQTTDEAAINNSSDRVMWKGGSVTGLILPLGSEVGIQVTNDKFSAKEYYYTKDGHFRFDRIPGGIYSVVITYFREPDYPVTDFSIAGAGELTEYIIFDIKVGAGKLTDLGIINLP